MPKLSSLLQEGIKQLNTEILTAAAWVTLTKDNTTSNNNIKFIQTGSHTIFHWFI